MPLWRLVHSLVAWARQYVLRQRRTSSATPRKSSSRMHAGETTRPRTELPLAKMFDQRRIRLSPRNQQPQPRPGRMQEAQACRRAMQRPSGHRAKGWLRSSSRTCWAAARTWSCRSRPTCPWGSSRANCAWNIMTRLPQPGSALCVMADACGTKTQLAPC